MTTPVPPNLLKLEERLDRKYSFQPQAVDLLPSLDTDLARLTTLIVPDSDEVPEGKRSNIIKQALMLRKIFARRTEIELLHGLVISYLRRDTPHTAKAWQLFRRIWEEHGAFMAETVSVRWLISALQTFHDHSTLPNERVAGAAGFLYGNMIKIYETEHHALKRDAPPTYKGYKNKSVSSMFGFKPGDDILININAFVLDAAKNGGAAGPALMRLLQVIAESKTIFQRTDALHQVEEFSRHPTFTLSFDGRAPARKAGNASDGVEKDGADRDETEVE